MAETPVDVALAALRPRTARVVWALFWHGRTFFELLRSVPGVGQKALSQELDEMEARGLVRRESGAGGARGRYALTDQGQRLKLVVGMLFEWGLLAPRDPRLAHERLSR